MPTYYEDLAQAVDACHQAGVMVNLTSPPGEGKTAWVRSTLAQRDTDTYGTPVSGVVITLLVSTMEGADFAGALTVSKATFTNPDTGEQVTTDVTCNATPAWAVEALASGAIVYIFADELNHGSRDVMGPLQTVIQDRIMPNGVHLGMNNRFIGAMNPRETINNGNELSSALTNRMVHIPFSVPFEDWVVGFMTNFGRDMSPAEQAARGLFGAYLQSNPSVLAWDPSADKTAGWSSKRSWDNAARIWALDPPMRDMLIGGTIGTVHVTALTAYIEGGHLPAPEDVWKDPSLLDGLNPHLAHAALGNVIQYGIEQDDPERLGAVLAYAGNDFSDVVIALFNYHVNTIKVLNGGMGLGPVLRAMKKVPKLDNKLGAIRGF